MKTIKELLRDADPLQYEPAWPLTEHDIYRRTILAAASDPRACAQVRSRLRIVVFAIVALLAIVVSSLGSHMWSPFVSDVQGAVRFEVRLAEYKPAPGLRETKVGNSEQPIYLHNEVIVDNGDIEGARIVQGDGLSHYAVEVKFNTSGTEKMRAATAGHLGKPMAILLDGRVVMAPVVRSPIGASALITGNLTKAQAERIFNGIGAQ